MVEPSVSKTKWIVETIYPTLDIPEGLEAGESGTFCLDRSAKQWARLKKDEGYTVTARTDSGIKPVLTIESHQIEDWINGRYPPAESIG